MDVVMHCRHGYALAHFARSQVAGDKLPDRLRSTSLAMLAVPAAIGLAFIAIALQQSWPSVLGGPIPTFSSQGSEREASPGPPSSSRGSEGGAPGGPPSVSRGVAARAQAPPRHSGATAAASPGGGIRS